MSVRLPPPFVALTPGAAAAEGCAELVARVDAALGAGLEGVLLREPELSDRELLSLARSLRERLGPGRWLGLHDRAHLVRAAAADALHLGFRSLPPALARRVVGAPFAIGFSSHAGDAPDAWRGADYLFHGPLAATASKLGWKAPVGLGGLAGAVRGADLPVWAIGGITPGLAGEALRAGARGVAALGGCLGAEDPAAATREFLAALAPRRGAGP